MKTCTDCLYARDGASACNPDELPAGTAEWVVAHVGEPPHRPAPDAPSCPGWLDAAIYSPRDPRTWTDQQKTDELRARMGIALPEWAAGLEMEWSGAFEEWRSDSSLVHLDGRWMRSGGGGTATTITGPDGSLRQLMAAREAAHVNAE